MRTLDPELWSKRIGKVPLNLSRPMRFGRRPQKKAESRTWMSFHDAMKEYWGNCSVSGVSYITGGNKLACASHSYTVLLLLLIGAGLFAVFLNAYERSTNEPSTVAQVDGLHTIYDVPFPAVGLCTNNVISRRALMEYTTSLVAVRQSWNMTYNKTTIARNLAQLGHLITMTLPQELVDINFMGYLATLDPRQKVSSLMLKLTPNCSSMLVRCSWRGQTLPCRNLFLSRVTPLGYCCVFNSRYQPEDTYKLPKFLDIIGKDYGLSVVIKHDVDDVIYFRRPSYDIDVLIFDGSDYPLLEGGGARLYPAEENTSVYLSLSASAHYPEDPEDFLRCRSRHSSGESSRRRRRSRAWCLAECRRRTLAALCSCHLHTLPPPPPPPPHPHPRSARHRHTEECSLTHLACLNKHREKFLYYYPHGHEASEQDLQNAQDCTHCVPDCARIVYSAAVAVSRYNLDKLFKDQLLMGVPPENVTTIKLYYSSEHLKSYVFRTNSRWYEKFVHFGSEWALIVGASVVSASELVFHCSLRWRHHYQRRTLNRDTIPT